MSRSFQAVNARLTSPKGQMDASIIKTLAENPPPLPKRRYFSAKECHARILELERVLGLPASPFTGYISRANARVAELERLLALRASAPSVPALPTASTPAVPTTTLCEMTAKVLKHRTDPKLPAPERRCAAAKVLFQAHITYPGCEADYTKLVGVWRLPDDRVTGLTRAIAAQNQAKADAFFAGHK